MTQLKGWREIPIGGMILEAGNAVEYRTGGWRAFRPVRGEAECTHCFQCWLFCPDSSILVDPENEKMVGFDLEHCKGCGVCASVCPVNAKVIRTAGEELARDDPRLCICMVEEGKSQE
ncbi:MAG TPA: 4Fe-4S dicluster domain-containing protein [Chloroflexi bacterium]|nr:4Fe-4S dicluster domain-containing protein [Chloroflexota bacterium]